MIDFTDLKVAVFNGINDLPITPTALKAGNGSHIIATINNLIDRLNEQFITINSNWNIVTGKEFGEITDLQPNSKNLLTVGEDNKTSLFLRLPINPTTGSYVSLLKAHEDLTCEISAYPQIRDHWNSTITLETMYEEITLVFLNENQGWVMSRNDVLTIVSNPI